MERRQFRIGVPQRGGIIYVLVGIEVCLAYLAAVYVRSSGRHVLVGPVFGFVLLILVVGNRWLAATRVRIDQNEMKVWPFGYVWRPTLIRRTDIRRVTVVGKSKIVVDVQLLDGSVTTLGPFLGWVRRNRELVKAVCDHLSIAVHLTDGDDAKA